MDFTSFCPLAPTLEPYIDYYYIQRYDDKDTQRYQCFPHLNNSLSLFSRAGFYFDEAGSHVQYSASGKPLALLTVIRKAPLWVHHSGPLNKVAIVFKPLGLSAFTEQPVGLLAPNFVAAVDPFCGALDALQARVFSVADPVQLVNLLDDFFLSLLNPKPQCLLESLHAAVINLDAPLSLHLVAEQHGISRRHMYRLFQQHFACSPEVYRQIARFRQVLQLATNPEDKQTLTALAHATRHTDQSHWNKQCRKWTGYSPKNLLHTGTNLGQKDTFWCLDFEKREL
ncbi:hypothetical protein GCM10028895_29910 [Pontibacter rugosus]